MTQNSIVEEIRKRIEQFETTSKREETGAVLEVGDGVARVSGLAKVAAGEMVEFENGVLGVALNLEEDMVGVILLGEAGDLR